MSPRQKYFTTTLPYVNSDPHIGHAFEFVQADCITRYFRGVGEDVMLNTGTDEHGQKIYTKALEANEDIQKYVDRYAERFKGLIKSLGIIPDINFIRTTDKNHIEAAQAFWNKCLENGDIYKKRYQIKYCVGCELEKTDSELENGICPIHPNLVIENIDEENYFFRFSKYQNLLLDLYRNHENFVVPQSRLNEIEAFVKRGLQDFSISRLKEKMSWGIPVPNDEEQVMYVWFDALVNYISAVGWPNDMAKFNKYWPVIQFAGKDNLRQQSAIWQAMLMSAGLEPSKQIVIHGFINSGGQKMSKSLGNVISPYDLVEAYGTEAVRLLLLRHVAPFEDSDITLERLKDAYNADLANGLGNLVSRIMKLSITHCIEPVSCAEKEVPEEYTNAFLGYNTQIASNIVWEMISNLDRRIQLEEPFKVVKVDKEKGVEIIKSLVNDLYNIAKLVEPFMPETSAKILKLVKENKMPEAPLFLRKE